MNLLQAMSIKEGKVITERMKEEVDLEELDPTEVATAEVVDMGVVVMEGD